MKDIAICMLSSCALAAIAAPAYAQEAVDSFDQHNGPSVVVVENHGDHISVTMQPGAKPVVTVNGKVVEADENDGVVTARDGECTIVVKRSDQGASSFTWTTDPSGLFQLGGSQRLQGSLSQNLLHLYADRVRAAGDLDPKPHIGVQVGSLPPALADHLALDPQHSVLILSAAADGAAAKAGVKANDILVAIDGVEGVTADSLRDAVGAKGIGDKMTLGLLRRGNRIDVDVVVGATAPARTWRPMGSLQPEVVRRLVDQYQPILERAKDGDADKSESLEQQLDRIRELCDQLQRQIEQQRQRGR